MPLYGSLSTNKTRQKIIRELAESFRKWGVDIWDAPYDQKARLSVAVVWFNLNGARMELRCSRFLNHATNLLAISLTVEGVRLASQRGILEQYRQFFKALPSGQVTGSDEDPYLVLGIREDASMEVADAAYRTLSRSAHPDAGGTQEQMTRLNRAITQIREQHKAHGPAKRRR